MGLVENQTKYVQIKVANLRYISLQDNNTEMSSTYNEGESVSAERFIRTLKNKIDKFMTSISKNIHKNRLYDIVSKYNNTRHNTIKMKLVDVKSSTFLTLMQKKYDEDPKFKVGDHVRISKHKNILAKGCTPNLSEERFVIKKVEIIVPWVYVSRDLNRKEIVGMFQEK